MGEVSRAPRWLGSRGPALWAVTLTVLVVFSFPVVPAVDAQAPRKVDPLERRVQELEREVARLKKESRFYQLDHVAEGLVLCNRKVPMSREDVRERFEREYFQLLENRGLLTVVVKRYLKYAGAINEEIQKMAVPGDLIFLVVTESYLNPRAVSKANAAGLWQFIKETGMKEGLHVNDHVDERYNVKKATRSALTHLKRLHGHFGDWLIAMAAYNAGRGRLQEAIENQETKDFFDLYLPEETERYIFRILSLKEIISNRERYGLDFSEKELYKPLHLIEVSFETHKEIHALTLAKAMDLTYKAFRDVNVHLKRYRLPKGTYTVNVPPEKSEIFLKRLKNLQYIEVFRRD